MKAFIDKNKLNQLQIQKTSTVNSINNNSSKNKTTVYYDEFKQLLLKSNINLFDTISKLKKSDLNVNCLLNIFKEDIVINDKLKINHDEMIDFIKKSFDFDFSIVVKDISVMDSVYLIILLFFKIKNLNHCGISSKYIVNLNEIECVGCSKFVKLTGISFKLNVCLSCAASYCQ